MSVSSRPFDLDDVRDRAADALDAVDTPRRRAAIALIFVVAAALLWFAPRLLHQGAPSAAAVDAALPMATSVVPASASSTASSSTGSSSSDGASGDLVVYVAGAVARPAIYHVPTNARVADAIDAAGGLAAGADADRLNLAAKVTDGQRVYVARQGQASVPDLATADTATGADGSTGAITEPIDLNAASAADLDRLPGVGPSTARAIVDYRTKNGPFRRADDLGKVKGIGPAKLAALRPLVRV